MGDAVAPAARVIGLIYVFGKILEVIGMLTLGVALFVYGFGEADMTAELSALLIGSLIFLAGYVLERRGRGTA